MRDRQRLVREDAILDGALELMSLRGFDAMTMDDLATHVGISKPTLYLHFASKDQIAVQAIVRMMRRIYDFMESVEAIVPRLPATERLERITKRVFYDRFIVGKPSLGTARATLTPVIRSNADYLLEYRRIVTLMVEIVESAKTEGVVEPRLATRAVVQMFFSLLRDTDYDDLIHSGECDAEAVATTLTRTFLLGIRKDNPLQDPR